MTASDLRRWRGGLSQVAAARLLGIGERLLRVYESGARPVPERIGRLIESMASKPEPGLVPVPLDEACRVRTLRELVSRLPVGIAPILPAVFDVPVGTWYYLRHQAPLDAPLPATLATRVRDLLRGGPYRGADLAAWRARHGLDVEHAAEVLRVPVDRLVDAEGSTSRPLAVDLAEMLSRFEVR